MSFNSSYIGSREDIVALVPASAKKILDLGCSVGSLGAQILNKYPYAIVHGVEFDTPMAEIARTKLDKVHNVNLDSFSLTAEFEESKFDCIVMADILEHLLDPWRVVQEAIQVCEEGGTIIACIPNVRHIDTIYNLIVKGVWPYRLRGIHDKTHLRFFTRKNIEELFSDPSLSLCDIEAHYRLLERPSRINKIAKYFALPGLKPFLAFQYIVVVRKISSKQLD